MAKLPWHSCWSWQKWVPFSHGESQHGAQRHSDFALSTREMESLIQECGYCGFNSLIICMYLQSDWSAMAQCHENKNLRHWLPSCWNHIQVNSVTASSGMEVILDSPIMRLSKWGRPWASYCYGAHWHGIWPISGEEVGQKAFSPPQAWGIPVEAIAGPQSWKDLKVT